jgi:hypothetical protein
MCGLLGVWQEISALSGSGISRQWCLNVASAVHFVVCQKKRLWIKKSLRRGFARKALEKMHGENVKSAFKKFFEEETGRKYSPE